MNSPIQAVNSEVVANLPHETCATTESTHDLKLIAIPITHIVEQITQLLMTPEPNKLVEDMFIQNRHSFALRRQRGIGTLRYDSQNNMRVFPSNRRYVNGFLDRWKADP
jgi:hypothetical protein